MGDPFLNAEGPQTDLVRALWGMTGDTQRGSAVWTINRLCDEADALRRRLAEVEAEHDETRAKLMFAWQDKLAVERRLAEVERLLLRQTNLNTEAITQRMAAEARLAEVEQALRDARLFTSKDYIAVGRAGLVVQMGAADDILAAVLDKEEHG